MSPADGDNMKKVRSGDPLVVPAQAYNAFIDAAKDYRQRTAHVGQTATPGYRSAGIVLVKNESGEDRDRFDVLGLGDPIFLPDSGATAEQSFKNAVAFRGDTPDETLHKGKFVILGEPLAAGAIGRAYAAGVCPMKIDVPDEDHEWRYAEIADGVTANLKASMQGSAGILWRAGGTGVQWAVVRLGKPIPMHVFPVDLTQYGGEQGDEENPATWTYDVLDVVTGETLESGVDPVAAPHKWQRPSIGQMIAATFGYAHYQDDGAGGLELVLGWMNEIVDQEACETASSPE